MASQSARYDRLIDDLRGEYRVQREWGEGKGLLLVAGHTLVGVAGGGWLLGTVFASPECLIAAYALAVGGAISHLGFLGRPERCWRMARQVATSWVARGFWGLAAFLAGGLLYALPVEPVSAAGYGLALTGALVMVGYMGFVYTASKAIPFWGSKLHPPLYIAHALRGGAALMLLAAAIGGATPDAASGLLEIWIAVTVTVAVLWGLDVGGAARRGNEAARRSVHELLAGRSALAFYAGTLAVGIAVPLMLMAGIPIPLSAPTLAAIGLASVIGDFFTKLATVRAGVYRRLAVRSPAKPD